MRKTNDQDSAEKIRDNKSFFCSELVATAYKRLGLLEKEKAASQYWPGEFSAENPETQIKFSKADTHLGLEKIIEFT